MQNQVNPEPLFNKNGQSILKYGLNGNSLKLSSLSEYCRPVDSSGLAIKFVVEGAERYTINKNPYTVAAGSYLLLNGEKDARVDIDSKRNVKGVCIHITNAVVADVAASFMRPDTAFADPDLASFLCTDLFLENQYEARHTRLGAQLEEIGRDIQKNVFSFDDINSDLFFELAERLITDQVSVFKQLQAVQAVKPATKRDLCRRLIRGREYIDSNFAQPLVIEQVASEAAISAFHFFRLFKKVFGVSPHQYILRKRLEAATHLLSAGATVSDVAIECGFSDIFTFSKTFKKHYGVAPSSYSGRK